MDIPSKNDNQSSVPVKVPLNKVSSQFFNNDTVNDHVSTNNKDFGIPNKKKMSTYPTKWMSTYLKLKMWTYLPRIIINHQFLLKFLLSKYPINSSIMIQ